jgi:hypothetical protein
MKKFRSFLPAIALVSLFAATPLDRAAAAVLVLDLSTTAAPATPLYGAAWNGSAIVGEDYGVNFRDFQFNLISSPSLSLSDLIVAINADAQNRVTSEVMGVTIWAGAITNAPTFSSALGTVTVSSTNWTGPGFQDINWGPGGLVPAQSIDSLPEEFFIRVWGTGANSPDGFKAKLGSAIEMAYATNTTPGLVMSNYDGTNYTPAPTFNYTGPTPAPSPAAVPEPGTWAMAALLLATGIYMRLRRRAQTA